MFSNEFPLELPVPLENAILKTLCEELIIENPAQIRFYLEKLWSVFTNTRGLATNRHYSQESQFSEAYAAYYTPVNVMKLPLILSEMQSLGLEFRPKITDTWLDLGSGPGTLVLGASWWFEKFCQTHPIYCAVEQSQKFLHLAQKFFSNHGLQARLNIQNLQMTEKKHFTTLIAREQPKYISFGNSLSELPFSLNDKFEILKDIIESNFRIHSSSWLIILEPGTKNASRDLLGIRELLFENSSLKEKFQLCLPCLNDRVCGAYSNPKDWCHEMYPFRLPQWHSDIGKKAGLMKEELIFSYLVIHIGKKLPLVNNQSYPEAGFRIVSQNFKEKGMRKCFVCTPTDKKSFRVLNSRLTKENQQFAEARMGEIFDTLDSDEKHNVLKATRLEPISKHHPTFFKKS